MTLALVCRDNIIDQVRGTMHEKRTAREHRRGHDRWFPKKQFSIKVGSELPVRFHDNFRSEKAADYMIFHDDDLKKLVATNAGLPGITETKLLPALIVDENTEGS